MTIHADYCDYNYPPYRRILPRPIDYSSTTDWTVNWSKKELGEVSSVPSIFILVEWILVEFRLMFKTCSIRNTSLY